MTAQNSDLAREKADRALVLSEQGLGRASIAERLGVTPQHVIQRAKQRREKASGEVEA